MIRHYFRWWPGSATAKAVCSCGVVAEATVPEEQRQLEHPDLAGLFPDWGPRGSGCPTCSRQADVDDLVERVAQRVIALLSERLRGSR